RGPTAGCARLVPHVAGGEAVADFEIVDTHVHTFPSAGIGRQAMTGASHGTDESGTIEELQSLMPDLGISHAAMVNFTTVIEMRDAALAKLPPDLPAEDRAQVETDLRRTLAGRIRRRNDWTCAVGRQDPRLSAFIGVDPTMMDPAELTAEVERCRGQGAKGIKLHPVVQQFHIDDERLRPIYETAQRLEMPIIFHGGYFIAGQGGEYARPRRLARIAEQYPRLTSVLAHCGVGFFEESIELAEQYPNVYFDCCAIIIPDSPLARLDDDELVNLLRRLGTDRVFYGSDWPFYDPRADLERLRGLALTDDEKRRIFSQNARRVLGF
ncbi:MAG TPA: amidohydrolase family protein, partial [Dehalococcoidia bacterium]|nr:amidohydrolase family protein [Dehalococcoidia bacterium]